VSDARQQQLSRPYGVKAKQMNLRQELEKRISAALVAAGAPAGSPALVVSSARPEFGDYQANGCMAAGKKLKMNPRQLAEKVVAEIYLDDIAEKLEIAGPGFINIKIRNDWLCGYLGNALQSDDLSLSQAENPQTVVVDYSAPNLAKEMHVGHLRSTIIGDAIVRVLAALGHNVIAQNHVGDWGTQFGMLVAFFEENSGDDQNQTFDIADLEAFYIQARKKFDADDAFAEKARLYVVKLQGGDEKVLSLWQKFLELSWNHCEKVYKRLSVMLTASDTRGESAYNDDLPKVLADLDAKEMLKDSQGAKCVFLDEFTGKDGEPLPVIVQKSDGGYLYATTDLAAIRYRSGKLDADRILSATDARQILHFRQIFAVARAAGFVRDDVSLEHVPFGMMMNPKGGPFKSRDGGTVKLTDLLDEAVDRAKKVVEEKNPDITQSEKDAIAEAVGIGAVKYFDLSHSRTSNYVFAWDKMLAMEGNTAPYMQYAHARVRSIFRKGALADSAAAGAISLTEPAERALGLKLTGFGEALQAVANDAVPHLLCNYLFELAGVFMTFYEACPVLKSDEPTRTSRLMLCLLTARTISTGMHLLGIDTPEQM